MCMAPVFGSNVVFCSGIDPLTLVPPVTFPLNAFPSHFSESVTSLRSFGLGPQSPDHVPETGSPWAKAEARIDKHAIEERKTNTLNRIQPPKSLDVTPKKFAVDVTTWRSRSGRY